uniref:Protein phosphatase n=1 Tax=Physcomitrium patens TaxID=3218 RepID=A0A7I4BT21_PHYPA
MDHLQLSLIPVAMATPAIAVRPHARLHHHHQQLVGPSRLCAPPGNGWNHLSRIRIAPVFPCVQFHSYSCSHQLVAYATSASQDQTALESTSVELAFAVGATMTPHPDKVQKGGEDAYFVSNYGGGVLGIADGVGGWAEQNVDPALYSKELMAHAEAAVSSEEMEFNAQMLLAKAHAATNSIGAATAIVALLERNGVLHVASVGDCGIRILRQGRVVFASQPQQHYFDCPYQFSSEQSGQSAADAMVFKAELKEGDSIVMGSDGLFDNVYDRDVETTLSVFGGSDEESAIRSAKALAALASKNSRDPAYESPYSKEAIQQVSLKQFVSISLLLIKN